jgi:cyclopropane-fatty-acyl-phospholipid synthase
LEEQLGTLGIELAERGWIPDRGIRYGIRRLLEARLRQERGNGNLPAETRKQLRLERLSHGPIAILAEAANSQHYEVPSGLYEHMLGPRMKYSSCLWDGASTLGQAEKKMLALTCQRAGIGAGQRILELGCGWGSLSLWMAEEYPSSSITAVSNSRSQAAYIRGRAKERGLDNLTVLTRNVTDFQPDRLFDRVVSVEMFEHLRNYREMLHRIASWLEPDGRCFVHIFCHKDLLYFFDARDSSDWMSETFFSGGIMPCDGIFDRFPEDMRVERHWKVSGLNYSRTLEAWLENFDRNRMDLKPIFESHYGAREAVRWMNRWRIFLMACSELFRFSGGNEWYVTHTLLRRASD